MVIVLLEICIRFVIKPSFLDYTSTTTNVNLLDITNLFIEIVMTQNSNEHFCFHFVSFLLKTEFPSYKSYTCSMCFGLSTNPLLLLLLLLLFPWLSELNWTDRFHWESVSYLVSLNPKIDVQCY